MSEKRKDEEWWLKGIEYQRVTGGDLDQYEVHISVEFERHHGQEITVWRETVAWGATPDDGAGHPSHAAAMLVELAKRIGDAFELPPWASGED